MKRLHSSVYLILLFILFITLGNVHTIALGHLGSHSHDLQVQEEKKDHHKIPSPERISRVKQQIVKLKDFHTEGLVLDIGGGGEGIIGQLKGKQCVAIDISKRELEEAPAGPLMKIVMDARDLKFLDNTFNTTTVFFTFMYIDSADHEKIFQEISRVLHSGGRLLIWDVVFPEWKDKQKDLFIFPLKVELPDKTISTGYGVKRPKKQQGLPHYVELGERTGFNVVTHNDNGKWFFLELKKE
ncbi:methyltransferase domain-containing protein [Acidobacteriota bacterium]